MDAPIRVRVGSAARVLAVALFALACTLPGPVVEGLFPSTEATSHPVPAAADCERCHQEVFREWERSLHARAWTHPPFQAASAEGSVEACTGCHAAAPVEGGVEPRLREAHRAEGVTCITCHLSPDPEAAPLTMRGPESRTSPVQIHPVIERDPLYRSSELCGTCHRRAYSEWRAEPPAAGGEEKPTCPSCHMPAVHRKMESVHDEHAYSALFVALGEERDLRRHDFAVPEPTEEEIGLSADWEPPGAEGPALEVAVANRIPHGLPTGEFGRREVRLRVTWPGGEARRSRSQRLREGLPAGALWHERFGLPAGTKPTEVAVVLERFDHGLADWRVLRRAVPRAAASAP